jgi:hypothetical protein
VFRLCPEVESLMSLSGDLPFSTVGSVALERVARHPRARHSPPHSLNLLRDDVRGAITARQVVVGLCIANEHLSVGIKLELPSEPVGYV